MNLLEAVPNLSSGSNGLLNEKIHKRLLRVESLWVLGIEPHFDSNRTVITLVGTEQSLLEGLFELFQIAASEIDMRNYQSIHPHIGAVDVCPIIPLGESTEVDAQTLVEDLAQLVWQELKIPVYFYHHSAKEDSRKKLAGLRAGNYPALEARIKEGFAPDLGEGMNVKSGASILGRREFLIAYNINLKNATLEDAKKIAAALRKKRGLCKMESVEFLGWYLADFKVPQISCNLRNYKEFGLAQVYTAVTEEAQNFGLEVSGSELIGLAPLDALVPNYSFKQGTTTHRLEPELLQREIAKRVQLLGLEELTAFDPDQKILELRLKAMGGPDEI